MKTIYGDDGVDDSAYNDGCHHGVLFCDPCGACDAEEEPCDELGCNFDTLTGQCRDCGAHQPTVAGGG